MNVYLGITVAGLLIKLWVSRDIFVRFPTWHQGIKTELLIFIAVFLIYSVVQILLFGPEPWAEAMGLERITVIRFYYFWDVVGLVAGGYLLLSLFNQDFHKRWWIVVPLVTLIGVGGYFVVMTDTMIAGIRPGPRGIITLSAPSDFAFLGQGLVYLFTLGIVFGLFRTYQLAKSNDAQIKNLYALVAAAIYDVSCLVGLHYSLPFLMASRGIIFYVVVLVIMQRNRFLDIRPVGAVTAEAKTMREISRAFRQYAAEEVGHRESMRRLERSMVAYKLGKITQFKDGAGSSLPQVAESMDVKLSSLYDILKRLDLDKPPKQQDA
ncbi:MAG: hypothetical protein Hals2KO_28250 [Halioglobus sp.]